MYTMGIDVGSTASKCVIVRDGREIAARSLENAGTGTKGPARAIEAVFRECGLTREDMDCVVATGYGRSGIRWADREMSELSCHAKGAEFLFPGVRTVIDIGGQDAKVLRVGAGGILENFVMNDKCAAGTGRFLDVMARILEVEVQDLAELAAQSAKEIDISSTCTVFAESEVISQLAGGEAIPDIVRGIHRSVAGRVSGLAMRIGVIDPVAMTGGVARNAGVVLALEQALNCKIATSPLAQYNGALGAALIGYAQAKRQKETA